MAAPARVFGWLFDAPRVRVSRTRIFARVDLSAPVPREWLVYSMAIATPSEVAMVLPVPAARVADNALSFVDLSSYPTFFSDLESLFPSPAHSYGRPKGRSFGLPARREPLVVHAVGGFEASYVPSLADFDRLDPRFRVPGEVWRERPEYDAFGFAVFKLARGKQRSIHPMALHFETSERDAVYFPTLHVHDGELHARADFDHTLFYQLPPHASASPAGPGEGRDEASPRAVMTSSMPAEQGVDLTRAGGTVVAGVPVHRGSLTGVLPNRDTRVSVD